MVEKFCMEKKLIYLLQVVYAQNRLVVVNTIASTFSDGLGIWNQLRNGLLQYEQILPNLIIFKN